MNLIALYKTPADPAGFDKTYFEVHLSLIKKVPGLHGVRVTRITRTVKGEEGWYMMAEMSFADADSRKAAMRSPEMAAAGENLDSFAKGLYTLLYAE